MRWSSPPRRVVSLGRGCQPAHQIRRITGIESAYPLDWLITTDSGVLELVTSGMSGLFDRAQLVRRDDGHVVHGPTQTVFFHEFPLESDVDAGYAANANRFAALLQRWADLMRSDERVVFVRQHGWDSDWQSCASALRDALTIAGPRLRFTLLYLTPNNADDTPDAWNEPAIVHRRLDQPDPYDWHGLDSSWDAALRPLLASPSLVSRLSRRLH